MTTGKMDANNLRAMVLQLREDAPWLPSWAMARLLRTGKRNCDLIAWKRGSPKAKAEAEEKPMLTRCA